MFEEEVDAMGDRLCQRMDALHRRFLWRLNLLVLVNLVLSVGVTVLLVKDL